MTFAWDDPAAAAGEITPFLEFGFAQSISTILTASVVIRPAVYNAGLTVRPLESAHDWNQHTEVQFSEDWAYGTAADQRRFVSSQRDTLRDMVRAGLGLRFGAFLENRLIADLGIYWDGEVARFNNVATRTEDRRKGACSTLLYEASRHVLQNTPCKMLVLEAVAGAPAARLYETVGFRPAQRLCKIEWMAKRLPLYSSRSVDRSLRQGIGNMTIRNLVFSAGILAALLSTSAFAQTSKARPGLPIDALAKTVWIEEFDASPDGTLIAYKSAEAGTYDIWTSPVNGGASKQLTKMPGREMAPVFSPDGKWIAFEADYKGVNVRDVYIIPAQGGDAIRLTEHPLNDANPMWAPDSKTLYVVTNMFSDTSIAAIDIASRKITRVGPGGGGASLSPDGKTFVFTRNTKPDDDDQSNSDVYILPVTGGTPKLLTPDTFNSLDSAPSWAPDSKHLAFISDRNGFNNLGVIDTTTGAATMLLTENIEHSEPRWSPDGKWISFTKNLNYQYQIFRIPAPTSSSSGGKAQQLTTRGGVNGGSSATGQTRGTHMWSAKGDQIFFYHSDPTMTGDVWTMKAAGGSERQITNHQDPAIRDPSQFVWPEFVEYKSFDGRKVAGLIYKPKGAKAGDKLPALYFFRANSNGQHPQQWHPYIQYFVSRGYLVFAPNFRGSTGRGKEYRQAVFTRGGEDDIRDAFIGMDALAADGWVDPKRVGAFGGSTGGYFTTASITKDPQRFKAGIVWYGATDLVTLSTYAGMEGWNKFLIGKTPMENPENYYNRSIIYHADRVKTPLLFLYAQGDSAARFQQIEQYGIQAKIHGNWYDWVEYAQEPHGWYHFRPDSTKKMLTIMSEMFDGYVLGEPGKDVKPIAAAQREGIKILRNPDIELWNSLANGRPPEDAKAGANN